MGLSLFFSLFSFLFLSFPFLSFLFFDPLKISFPPLPTANRAKMEKVQELNYGKLVSILDELGELEDDEEEEEVLRERLSLLLSHSPQPNPTVTLSPFSFLSLLPFLPFLPFLPSLSLLLSFSLLASGNFIRS